MDWSMEQVKFWLDWAIGQFNLEAWLLTSLI